MKTNFSIFTIILLLMIKINDSNAQCSPEYYYNNEICLPHAHTICPANSLYINGVCKYRSKHLCPTGMIYTNGVCAKMSTSTACTQSPQECVSSLSCPSNNLNVCPYKQICPEDTIMYNGRCVTSYIAQCPMGSVSENGYCVRKSTCPPNTYLYDNRCIEIPKTELTVECAFGSHRVGDVCVQDLNVVCPDNSTAIGGSCIRTDPCPKGTFPYQGICAECPLNSQFINGQCISCNNSMIYKNGRCVCEEGKQLLGNVCVIIEKIKCANNEILQYDKCIPRYCYGNQCCKDSSCNDCFKSCEEISTTTAELSKCHGNCINNIFPTRDPIFLEPTLSEPTRYEVDAIFVNLTTPPTVQSQPSNYTNIVNVTNLVNSSSTQNIETKSNNSNINNIDVVSNHTDQLIDSNQKDVQLPREEYEIDDIVIPPPRPIFHPPPPIFIQRPPPLPKIILQQPQPIQQPQPLYIQQQPIQQPQSLYIQQQPIQQSQPLYIQQQPIQQPQPLYIQQQPIQQPQPLYIQQQPQIVSQPYLIQKSQPYLLHQQQIVPQPLQIVLQQPQQTLMQPICTYQNGWPFYRYCSKCAPNTYCSLFC